MDYPKFKVCVTCHTYNQSKYITDALNGFVMQETDFPFVCCIVDDASTDGEQDVIKKYIEDNFDLSENSCHLERETDYAFITYAQHKTNLNCYFAVLYLKENHYSVNKDKLGYLAEWRDICEYEALCEGDDYWISSFKLQKQYDLLEAHIEFSLCHHSNKILINGELLDRKECIPYEQDILSVAENNTIRTQTMFYRNIHEPIVPTDFNFKYPVYQFFWNLRLAEFGNIVYIDEPMAVYRINEGGIWSLKSPWKQYIMSIGNMENMITWYSQRVKRPDIVKILKQKARKTSANYIRRSIRSLSFVDIIRMSLHSIRFIG